MSEHTNETRQADGAGEPRPGATDAELSEAQLETAAGGGLGDAIQWAIEQFNEAGKKLLQAAGGGMLP
jgi:hypothetical protein